LSGRTFESVDPATGSHLADVAFAEEANAERLAELESRDSGAPLSNADFRTGISALGSGEFEVELSSAPPGDGGVGGQVGSAEDG